MTVAVLLLTADRLDYTQRTLKTFSAQHPQAREQFLLLHADDCSTDPGIFPLAAAHGFDTVVRLSSRRGHRVARNTGIRLAAERGADWLILLENDWEWVRPFPWTLFTHLTAFHPTVYTLRLYGQYKERGQRMPCMRQDLSRGKRFVTWKPITGAPEPAELARIHWGGPPAVTRMRELLTMIAPPMPTGYDPRRDSQPEVTNPVNADVARVVTNCVYHIGAVRTPRQGTASAPDRYTLAWQAKRRKYVAGAAACFTDALRELGTPASVLDVGCGEGHLVTQAVERGINAHGVDLSQPGVQTIQRLRHADLREPLEVGFPFDLVLCWEVAEHLPESSADTLCASLVRHMKPGGVLLFTAASPGQKGDGHINCQPKAYWAYRFRTLGLVEDSDTTARLSRSWATSAPQQSWYAANLQVFLAPGDEAVFVHPPALVLPRLALTMRTADRSPNPNYVGRTVAGLLAQGVNPADLHICATAPDVEWLTHELRGAAVTLHVPDRVLTPNENGLAQIAAVDPTSAEWLLLLEDDLEFCADFVGSVQRWIAKHAREDRHVYRLFGFRVPPPPRNVGAYDASLKGMAGSQAVILRMEDAVDFHRWAQANLESWGGFRGNAKIAFDKLIYAWASVRWPNQPGVMSAPFFVGHIGDKSSLHPRAERRPWAGQQWSFV